MKYEAVIGLEAHAQLLTETKIFCGCEARYGAKPNTLVCPTCLGLPGALPAINGRAVDLAVRAALALGCEVSAVSRFARKSYFYPDLPKGYQITQYDAPLAMGGSLVADVNGRDRRFGIERLHLEEDAGKNTHLSSGEHSLVDFNRAGVPLIEIVSRPDMRTPAEAVAFARALKQNLEYIGVVSGGMETGSLRFDGNISVRAADTDELGTRVELKNLNSFGHLKTALRYEFHRQTSELDAGRAVAQETRQWIEHTGRTEVMRTKESTSDYRYFSEPDLPDLRLGREWIDTRANILPELPWVRRQRFEEFYRLPRYDAGVLTSNRALADYYEAVAAETPDTKLTAGFIMGEVLRVVREHPGRSFLAPVPPADLADLLAMVTDGTVSRSMARTIFEKMLETGNKPKAIVRADGFTLVVDPALIKAACAEVLAANPTLFEQYRAGKTALLDFFVGQVMKAMRDRADPKLVKQAMRKMIDE